MANQDFLFVPSGRTLPAAFNRKTGEYEYKRTYSWRTSAGGVVGGSKAMLSDGQLFSFGAHHMLALDQQDGDAGHAYVGGRQMAVQGEMAYIANGKELIAVNRAEHTAASRKRQKLFVQRRSVRSDKKKVAEINKQMEQLAEVGIIWRAPFTGDSSLISTGDQVIAGSLDQVAAWDRKTGKPIWSAPMKAEARGLAVANGGLFVSTTDGAIHCFRNAVRDRVTLIRPTSPKNPYGDGDTPFAAAAKSILDKSQVSKGFCLVLGGGQCELAYELARKSDLLIYVVEDDPKLVAAARTKLRALGVYGDRISLIESDLSKTTLPNYFANLVVSQSAMQSGKLPPSAAELGRYVKPCGGKVCLGAPGKADAKTMAETLRESYLRDDAQITTSGDFAVLTRGKLPGASDWSHQYGNVSNTSFTEGPPRERLAGRFVVRRPRPQPDDQPSRGRFGAALNKRSVLCARHRKRPRLRRLQRTVSVGIQESRRHPNRRL